jgi:hypothetical protein
MRHTMTADEWRHGRCEGRKPFGFYQGESAVLDRVKALRTEGLGFDRIAVRLNEDHVPTRTGRPWHGIVINRIGKRDEQRVKAAPWRRSGGNRLRHG